jgi:DNA repair protein RadD
VCLEHTGYARTKAEAWWRQRSGEPVPSTVAAACRLAQAGLLATPTHITVRTVAGEEFERITGYRLGSVPAVRESGDDGDQDFSPQTTPSSDDEPPF